MRRALPIGLAALALCGFGAGPFWGENKGPSAPSDPTVVATTNCFDSENGKITPMTCTHDATGHDALAVFICGLRQDGSSSWLITTGTPATFNGVAMTQLAFVNNSTGPSFPDCGLYWLDSPTQGSAEFSLTPHNNNGSNAWVVSVFGVNNAAAVQSGFTGTDASGASATTAIALTGIDVGDLTFHYAATRNRIENACNPCTSDTITKQGEFGSGPATASDLTALIAHRSEIAAGGFTNTITYSSTDRYASIAAVIKP